MELRVLKYFLTVADEGNITRAADILHVTQPTLSRQLIELEDELGTALLIRGKRSVTLTDEGFLFKQQAEMIVELSDKLEHTFKDKKRRGLRHHPDRRFRSGGLPGAGPLHERIS